MVKFFLFKWIVFVAIVGSMVAGCGAKTGFRDAAVSFDIPVVIPRCLPYRIQVPLGQTAELRVELDGEFPQLQGFQWSLQTGPTGSSAQVNPGLDRAATFTPDLAGTYTLVATAPFATLDAGVLACEFTVESQLPDPSCPNEPVRSPRVFSVQNTNIQIALDPTLGSARMETLAARDTTVVGAESAADNVAVLLIDRPATGNLETEGRAVEAAVTGILGATPVLVGTTGTTLEGDASRRSLFRVTASAAAAADVARDRFAREFAGIIPGIPRAGLQATRDFTVEVNTALRARENRVTVLFAVANESDYDDASKQTNIRFRDFVNATGLVRGPRSLELVCQSLPTTRTLTADFLWLVDTSSSMDDDQERLGRTATRFFQEMQLAGVDFRVGVVQAGGTGPVDLDSPGFSWILGSDPGGARRLAFETTHLRYQNDAMDRLAPYPLFGNAEEPVSAGVLVAEEMARRMNDPNNDRRFRPGAQKVMLFASDERGTNDDMRFFALNTARWGATPEARVANIASWYESQQILTFGLANLFDVAQCPSMVNLVPCLTVRNGGAYIPLSTATDAEVSAAFSRIVDTIAGLGSEYVFPRLPISSSLRVRVEETSVPRSRQAGFDVDDTAQRLIFRGAMYQPRMGQLVRAAYFAWRMN